MTAADQLYRQQVTLSAWLRRRDDRSLAEACEAWDPLPCSWAAKYLRAVRSCRLELSDLIQDARVGLVEGFRRYDPDRAAKFSTYASWKIRGALSHSLRSTHYFIRPPADLLEKRTTARLMGLDTVREVAAAFGIPDERAAEIIGLFGVVEPVSTTWVVARGMLFHAGEYERGQDDPELARIDARETLLAVLPRLRDSERRLLERLYLEEASFASIADETGTTRQAVYGREKTAMASARRAVGV